MGRFRNGEPFSGRSGILPGCDRISPPRRSEVQTLYYVQANVADDFLKSNGSLLKWAGHFGRGNVYLKAASYLLHEPYFSRIRSFLLNHAASVLQDDSGIPVSLLPQRRLALLVLWDLFGNTGHLREILSERSSSSLCHAGTGNAAVWDRVQVARGRIELILADTSEQGRRRRKQPGVVAHRCATRVALEANQLLAKKSPQKVWIAKACSAAKANNDQSA